MDYFTLITGLASLFAFIVQMFDFFPKLAEARRTAALLLAGVCVGSLIRAFDASSIKFTVQVTGFMLLLVAIGVVIVCALVVAWRSVDRLRRREAFQVAGVSAGLFMFVLVFVGMFATLPNFNQNEFEKQALSVPELVSLAEQAEARGDIDRAIMHLQTLQTRLGPTDERSARLGERIAELKKKEVK